MTHKMITDDIIDEMLNDILVLKFNSYINFFEEFNEN